MREIPARAVLVLASLLVAFALAEGVVRVAGMARRERRATLIEPSSHSDLAYVLAPGAVLGEGPLAISINSHGIRDREVSLAKPPGTRRIVVIGDSITFGMRVAMEESYPKQLEKRLAGLAPPTQVLNLGVGGYDVLNAVALLEERGLRFEPDLVVLGLCINDVGIQSANLRFVERMSGWWWLANRSHLVRFAFQRLEKRRLQDDLRRLNSEEEFARRNAGRIASLNGDDEQRARMAALASALAAGPVPGIHAAWYTSEQKIGRLRHAFSRLAALARRQRFEVVVAIIPYLDEGGRPEVFRQVYEISAHEARRAGFRVVRLRNAFAERGMAALRGGSTDPLHPNAEGHALIARALFDELRAPGG